MKTEYHKQRLIVRYLCELDASDYYIASLTGASRSTVRRIRLKLEESHKTWQELAELNQEEFLQALDTAPKSIKKSNHIEIDFGHVVKRLKTKGMTRQLIWEELAESQPNFMSISQFRRRLKKWMKENELSMPQVHTAGDKVFIDFSGLTMKVQDSVTGNVSIAEIFVATLGASGYTFVYATPSQKLNDWIDCHIKMLEFFGGVPNFLVPDNLKSGVTQNNAHGVVVNRNYESMAEHYNCAVLPTRVRKPQDKAMVESAVKTIQQRILVKLKEQTFFSIQELNEAITHLLQEFNERITKQYPESRKTLFLEIEKPALKALPNYEFLNDKWQYNLPVSKSYLFQYNGKSYSAPFELCHKKIDVCERKNRLLIFYQNREMGSHSLQTDQKIVIDPKHMPESHRKYYDYQPENLIKWAEEIGTNTLALVEHYLKTKAGYANNVKMLNKFIKWVNEESLTDYVERACTDAKSRHSLDINYVERLIKRAVKQLDNAPLVTIRENIRGADYYELQENMV